MENFVNKCSFFKKKKIFFISLTPRRRRQIFLGVAWLNKIVVLGCWCAECCQNITASSLLTKPNWIEFVNCQGFTKLQLLLETYSCRTRIRWWFVLVWDLHSSLQMFHRFASISPIASKSNCFFATNIYIESSSFSTYDQPISRFCERYDHACLFLTSVIAATTSSVHISPLLYEWSSNVVMQSKFYDELAIVLSILMQHDFYIAFPSFFFYADKRHKFTSNDQTNVPLTNWMLPNERLTIVQSKNPIVRSNT